MEALIMIFGELIFAILMPFAALVAELIGSVASFVFSILFGRSHKSKISGGAARKLAVLLIMLAVCLLAAIWAVNRFYFDSAVRYVFGVAEKRSAIVTTCEGIRGSLFKGTINLSDCTMQRESHPTSTFDVRIGELEFDLRVTSLLGTATIDRARVSGMQGWINSHRSQRKDDYTTPAIEKPRRSFVIIELDIAAVDIVLSGSNPDGNPFELPLQVEEIRSQPLRSNLALFDLLFRSTMRGTIAGAPFDVSSAPVGEGRETYWRAEQLPVASLGAVTGGSLSWFSSGFVDVRVDDQWQMDDSVEINMDWQLNFEALVVSAPPGTGRLARMAAAPFTRYINGMGGQFPLEFNMVVNENQFEYASSMAAAGLWTVLGESVNSLFADVGINLNSAKETGNALKDGATSVLDQLRKPRQDKNEVDEQ